MSRSITTCFTHPQGSSATFSPSQPIRPPVTPGYEVAGAPMPVGVARVEGEEQSGGEDDGTE